MWTDARFLFWGRFQLCPTSICAYFYNNGCLIICFNDTEMCNWTVYFHCGQSLLSFSVSSHISHTLIGRDSEHCFGCHVYVHVSNSSVSSFTLVPSPCSSFWSTAFFHLLQTNFLITQNINFNNFQNRMQQTITNKELQERLNFFGAYNQWFHSLQCDHTRVQPKRPNLSWHVGNTFHVPFCGWLHSSLRIF